MYLQNGLAPGHIGTVQHDTAVETSRSKQSRVQDIGAVRRRDNDDVGIGIEAVHLH